VGGGDGGCLRRVLEHPVQEVVQVEIDADVVDTCLRWLPDISAGAYDDPRASLVIEDAMRYLDRPGPAFDAILVDSTDPVGAATPLFSERFYQAARRRLTPDGILVTQSGSPLLMLAELRRVADLLRGAFRHVATYLAPVPSYPGVLWSFCASSQGGNPVGVPSSTIRRRLDRRGIRTSYLTPSVQRAAFELPRYLRGALGELAPEHVHPPVRTVSLEPSLH
jgi:spermidine synthase